MIINKQIKNVFYKVISIILSFMIVFSSIITSINSVYGASVNVTTKGKYYYGDYNLGTNNSWFTYNYQVEMNGKKIQAVCMQPDKNRPGSGSYTVSRMPTDSMAAKAMYYGWYAPKSDLYWTNHYNSLKTGARYIIVHMTTARAMGENWSYKANSTAKTICTNFYNWLKNQPDIPGNNDVFFQNTGKVVEKLTEPPENANDYFKTSSNVNEDFKWLLTMTNHFSRAVSLRNWNENQDFELILPDDIRAVIMENNSNRKIKRVTDFGETVHLSGDQSGKWIYSFILKNSSDAKKSVITLKGTSISSSYKAYKLKLNGSSSGKQILGALDKDPSQSSSQLVINWEDDTQLTVSKSDEYGKAIEGAKFEIGRSKTDNKVSDVIKTITTNKEGEFSIQLDPGTYYVQEVSVPNPFVLDKTIQTVTLKSGDDKTIVFENRHQTGSLTVTKLDDTTKEPIQGAIYKLTNTTPIYFYNVNIDDFEPDPNLEGQLGNDDIIDDDILDDMNKDEPTKVEIGDFTYSFYANDIETKKGAVINNLPIGTYKLEEVKAPVGYTLSKVVKNIEVKYDSSKALEGKDSQASITVSDNRIKGEIQLIKVSSSSNSIISVGDAKLIGAKFGLYAKYDIKDPANDSVIYKAKELVSKKGIVGDEGIKIIDEKSELIWNNLPLGVYEIRELEAPEGYRLNDEAKEVVLKQSHLDDTSQIIKEKVIFNNDEKTSILSIKKVAACKGESGITQPEEGIHFYVVASKYIKQYGSIEDAWKHRDNFVNKDMESAELITDKDGYAKSNELAYGDYSLKQMSSGEGTLDLEGIFEISLRPECNEIEQREYVINNYYYESYVRLIKKDLKTNKNITLNGATFKIFNIDENEYVTQQVGPFLYNTFTTNSDNYISIKGIWNNIDDVLGTTMAPLRLSYGHYRVEEIKTPQGFLELERPVEFTVSQDQSLFEVTHYNDSPVIEVVIKNDKPTGRIILNKTFEQSYTKVDKFAKFRLTATKDIIDAIDGSFIYKKGDIVDEELYSINEKGQIIIENLPLGINGASYQLEEIETDDHYALLEEPVIFDFVIEDNKTKVYTIEKTIENELIEIHTKVNKEEQQVSKEMSIIDTVFYEGLHTGKEYTIQGILMDKETNKPLLIDGKEVVSQKTFIADKRDGSIDLNFTFDGSLLAGITTVVFEDLYSQDKLIASHNDINDRNQSVVFIDIHTIATADLEKEIQLNPNGSNKNITIVDTVFYQGLTVGKEYQLKGRLIDKFTEKPFLSNQKEVVSLLSFTPKEERGEIQVEFIINSNDLKEGHDIVVYENLYRDNNLIAVHEDVNDMNQTIKVSEFDIPVQGDKIILSNLQVNKIDSQTKEIIKGKDFEFGLYLDEKCSQIITKEQADINRGIVTFKDLKFGTYYLKEEKAPKGYLLSQEVKKIVIDSQNCKKVSIDFGNKKMEKIKTDDQSKVFYYSMGMSLPLISMLFLRKKNG